MTSASNININPRSYFLNPEPFLSHTHNSQTHNKVLKIAVLGTRGFPDVQGGVERHCENLYPGLVKLGCEVIVFGRSPYIGDKPFEYKGIKIVPIPCPKNKFLEAFIHTFKGIIAAIDIKPDILHIHAIGPSLLLPIARIMGLKVIMTHHGPDYMRKKWNWVGKLVLKIGENNGCRNANTVICVSKSVAWDLRDRYKRDITYIPNGINIPENCQSSRELEKYGLEKGKYILAVGRFVPEKGFHDLVEAYELAHSSWLMAHRESKENFKPQIKSLDSIPSSYELSAMSYKLAIVGDADHEDKYSIELKKKAASIPGVVMTGLLKGEALSELYSNAGLFVLPSYYEGLPIVLLEAMSYGLSCIVSDIPANWEVDLDASRYFTPGNINEIKRKIRQFIIKPITPLQKELQIRSLQKKYNWDLIIDKTFNELEMYLPNCPT